MAIEMIYESVLKQLELAKQKLTEAEELAAISEETGTDQTANKLAIQAEREKIKLMEDAILKRYKPGGV